MAKNEDYQLNFQKWAFQELLPLLSARYKNKLKGRGAEKEDVVLAGGGRTQQQEKIIKTVQFPK